MSQPASADTPTPPPGPTSASTAGLGAGNALPLGHRLHEFEITGLIGEGGFGIVYLARDTQLHRTVAIKEYMPSSLATRNNDHTVTVKSERHRETFGLGLRSFVNEARLLASFDHPALIKVYRFWEDNGTAYMVMPFYQGPTLKTWLREHPGAVDEAWLKGVLAPLLDALDAIHADHCYHRDIAPDNILLLGPNKPLLLDFGAARRVIGDATQALTVILKPGYAPVEQYAEVPSMKQGPWTDVYALCAVLYATILGKAPPPSVGRMMKDDMTPVSKAAAGRFSAPFLAAIDRGLTVNPDLRLQNIGQLREALFSNTMPEGFVVPAPTPEDDERTVLMPAGTDPATLVTQGRQGATQMTATSIPTAFQKTMHVPRSQTQATGQPAPQTAMGQGGASGGMSGGTSGGGKAGMILAALGAVGLIGAGAAWFMNRPHDTSPAVAAQTSASPTAIAQAASAPVTAAPATTTNTPPATPSLPPQRVPFSIDTALEDIVRNADPLMAVNAIADKSQLVIGQDKLLFQVKSSVPGYLYVYLAGTDQNHFYLLFPNALDRNNRIEADKLIQLPRKGWHITAGGPPGVNHIVTIVSPNERDLSGLGLNMKDAIPEFDMAEARRMWTGHQGAGSPFVGPAICDKQSPCEQRYGATLVHIEEVAR